jgi:Putative beta-barrel porin 2
MQSQLIFGQDEEESSTTGVSTQTTTSPGTTTGSATGVTGSPTTGTGAGVGTTDLSATSTSSAPAGGGEVPLTKAPGAGVFSRTPMTIDVSVTGGYDDNVDNAPNNGQGSGYTSGNIALSYQFGEPRLQLAVNAGAGGTYYYSHISGQDYDINLTGTFRITYNASPRLTLGATVLLAYLTEPSFNYGVGVITRNGNYFYTTDQFFAEYAWTQRFSTRSQYTVSAIKYEDSLVGAFQDRVENTFGNEFRFLAAPTTSLVGEYRFEVISYDEALLNSTTHFILAGFDHAFTPQLKATFRGGDEFRSYTHDGDQSSPYFEGNLSYLLGKRTTISWSNWYGLGEPNVTSDQSRTTFHTGLIGDVNLTSRIGTSLSLFYEHSDYGGFTAGGPSFTQDSYDIGLSVRYAINRMVRVQAGYHHSEVTSDISFFSQNYSRNSVFAGVNITF